MRVVVQSSNNCLVIHKLYQVLKDPEVIKALNLQFFDLIFLKNLVLLSSFDQINSDNRFRDLILSELFKSSFNVLFLVMTTDSEY